MPRLFDAYIMVDWSAAAKPVTGANSIWIGVLAKDARFKFQFQAVNPETRLKARTFLEQMLAKLTGRGDRVLLGFDFSLGYPAGTAAALGLDISTNPPWLAMHTYLAGRVKEKADNSNARFAIAAGMNYAISKGPYPFWGAPKRDQATQLSGTKPNFTDGPLAEFRAAERYLKDAKLGNPKSCWQLAYTGSVGSQSLLGIPHVHKLRTETKGTRLWPFETGLTEMTEEALNDTKILIAEIYPSLVEVVPEPGEVLDKAQVRAIAHHYCDLDGKGDLGRCFAAPDSLNTGILSTIDIEEGWILGK